MEHFQDWGHGEFVAVQWRTELSTGDLGECYQEVKAIVEGQRAALGYGAHQVLFNVDFLGKTSATYTASVSLDRKRNLTNLPQLPFNAIAKNRVMQLKGK